MDDTLGNVFEKLMEEQFSQEKLTLLLVKEKLQEHGLELTNRQEKQCISHFRKHGLNDFTLKLNHHQQTQLKALEDDNLILDFADADLIAFQEKIYSLSADVGVGTAKKFIDNLVQGWKKRSRSVQKKIKKERNKFINYHNKVWGNPFDLLESLINLCLEMGDNFRQRFSSDKQSGNDISFYVLERLHVRGCQVSLEILTLLRGGFADGAHARWRTLHEIAVIAEFISNHDNELAERYLAHSAIVEYQRALQFRKHSDDLSYAPMSDDDFARIKSDYEAVKEKYKGEFNNSDWFRNDYWWASGVLGTPHPNFVTIEENVGASFMQPFVKLAHVNVHAGSVSVFLRLGSPPNDRDLLIAGASTFGVGEPGQNAAYSIYSLTSTLLSYKNKNLDNMGVVKAIEKIMEEVMQEFDVVIEKHINTK